MFILVINIIFYYVILFSMVNLYTINRLFWIIYKNKLKNTTKLVYVLSSKLVELDDKVFFKFSKKNWKA